MFSYIGSCPYRAKFGNTGEDLEDLVSNEGAANDLVKARRMEIIKMSQPKTKLPHRNR